MNESQFIGLYANILKQKKMPVAHVQAGYGEVFLPRDFIDEDGTIRLYLSPDSVRHLKVLDEAVHCRATFDDQVFSISFPLANILEMYPG